MIPGLDAVRGGVDVGILETLLDRYRQNPSPPSFWKNLSWGWAICEDREVMGVSEVLDLQGLAVPNV